MRRLKRTSIYTAQKSDETRLNMLERRIPNPLTFIHVKSVSDTTTMTVGDDKRRWTVIDELDGQFLRSAHITVTTASSSGIVTVQIHNIQDAADLLSTKVTIDANERTSYTAVTDQVVNTLVNQVAVGDVLRIDVDVAGTGAKGLEVIFEFGPQLVEP